MAFFQDSSDKQKRTDLQSLETVYFLQNRKSYCSISNIIRYSKSTAFNICKEIENKKCKHL